MKRSEERNGCARLTRALAHAGVPCEAWDYLDGPGADLSQPVNLARLISEIRGGNISLVWLGTPCESFFSRSTKRWTGPAASAQ